METFVLIEYFSIFFQIDWCHKRLKNKIDQSESDFIYIYIYINIYIIYIYVYIYSQKDKKCALVVITNPPMTSW